MDRTSAISLVESQCESLEGFVRQWQRLKGEALGVQGMTEKDLGYSPTGTGQQRHGNISKLLDVRTQLAAIQDGINELLNQGLNGANARAAHATLGEVKHKYYAINKQIEEFEESRVMYELNLQPKIVESNEEYADQNTVNDESSGGVFEMEFTETPEEKSPVEGDPLKKYIMQKKLRNTLQGELYHATIAETGKDVAIKACRKDLIESGLSSSGNRVMEDARNEVKVMEMLQKDTQENVLRLIESFETSDKFYIVLEYAARGEFFDIVSQAGRLDDEVAKHYFKQLAQGLCFMHKRGVCHLDLSLENLLMDGDGILKICDFGLAREISASPFKCLTRPGKIQYMSPEIFSCQDFYGEQSDMFSLGVILFVILAGFPPFDRPAVSDMRFSYILNGHMKVLLKRWKLASVISPSAVDLLSKLLCPAEQRITIEEVLHHPWLK